MAGTELHFGADVEDDEAASLEPVGKLLPTDGLERAAVAEVGVGQPLNARNVVGGHITHGSP